MFFMCIIPHITNNPSAYDNETNPYIKVADPLRFDVFLVFVATCTEHEF